MTAELTARPAQEEDLKAVAYLLESADHRGASPDTIKKIIEDPETQCQVVESNNEFCPIVAAKLSRNGEEIASGFDTYYHPKEKLEEMLT